MIVGIIPARGGSKGIPKKNLKNLMGRPLVVWSIKAARRSTLLDQFFVSTDDLEIAKVCQDAGAKVIMRPDHLATDDATTVAVMQYHLTDEIKTMVLLQPTSPLRGSVIDRAIRTYLESGADTLATGYYSTHVAWGAVEHGPRQNQEPYFHDDGCVYIFDREVVKAGRWIGDKPYKMAIPAICNHEIDTIEDFWCVEGILRNIGYRGAEGR